MAEPAKSENSCDGDRISNLPDGIRCHILAFLPTKDAVATTILSTKWKNLWTTAIQNIDFDDYIPIQGTYKEFEYKRAEFARSVNKVLLSLNVPVLKRFSLNCTEFSPLYDVHSWVKTVILKKIQKLRLFLEAYKQIQLPISLFTCETLEELRLHGSVIVRVLASCSFPKLKFLSLSKLEYENDESACSLISSCPSLESLVIIREMDDGVENFIINSSTLKDLEIDLSNWGSRLLHNHVINTPALQRLAFNGPLNGLFIENFSSLVKTDFQFAYASKVEVVDDHFYNLLREICNTKILSIPISLFQSAIHAHPFPKFDKLSELEVSIDCCEWDLLQEFIRNSAILEALTIWKGSCRKEKHVVCWRNPEVVPICLVSSLKTMTFLGFDGLEDELSMVGYILKNAKIMQEMEIDFECHLLKTDSSTKLLKLPKASEECQIIIY